MTLTTQEFNKQGFKKYDTVNTVYILFVGYKYSWGSNNINKMTYAMRYTNDYKYSGNLTEVFRVMDFLSKRVTLEYLKTGNPLTKAILYLNKNRGGTESFDNPEVFSIDFDANGFIKNEPLINMDPNTWRGQLKMLEEFSKSNRILFLQQSKQ